MRGLGDGRAQKLAPNHLLTGGEGRLNNRLTKRLLLESSLTTVKKYKVEHGDDSALSKVAG